MHFKCLGISNFHIIAYNDTYVRLILQRILHELRTSSALLGSIFFMLMQNGMKVYFDKYAAVLK
jgi:hypothetical protein